VTVATPIRAALNNLADMCDNLGAIHGDYVRSALEAWDKLYKVEAENKRLRATLQCISDSSEDWGAFAEAALKEGE
jgi:hypothetical protein